MQFKVGFCAPQTLTTKQLVFLCCTSCYSFLKSTNIFAEIVVDEKDQGPPDPNVLKAAKLVEMVLPEEETSDFGDLLYELHPDEPIAGETEKVWPFSP